MLTDSIVQIEDHLESILETASKTTNDAEKYQLFEKFIRFWNLMEILHKVKRILHLFLFRKIFIKNFLQHDSLSNINSSFD